MPIDIHSVLQGLTGRVAGGYGAGNVEVKGGCYCCGGLGTGEEQ